MGEQAERLLRVMAEGGGTHFVDAVVADAEERWERGLEARAERYIGLIPQAFEGDWGDQLLRALLMCEIVRRRTETLAAVGADVAARFKERSESVEAVMAMAELVGEWEAEKTALPVVAAVGMEAGKYRLLERLGAGSFGEVWRAWDTELDRHVAIKLLDAGSGDSSRGGRAFVAEAQAAAGLDHEHVVRVHAAGWFEELGRFFIDSQLVSDAAATREDVHAVAVGRSLEAVVRAGGVLRPRAAAELMERVCRGVAAAHGRGILHRDLKPSNVLLTPSGKPLVADFGLSISGLARRTEVGGADGAAGSTSGARHTVSVATESGGRIVGTPAFMAPEQAAGRLATPATDVFGLGATLRFALTAEAAYAPTGKFHADGTKDVIEQARRAEVRPLVVTHPEVPERLAKICGRAMARDPAERYVSADQLAADLRAWLDLRPTLAARDSVTSKVGLWYRRNLAAATVGVLGLVVAVGLSVGFVRHATAERDRAIGAERAATMARDRAVSEREIDEAVNRFSADTIFTSMVSQGFRNEILLYDVMELADERAKVYKFEKPLVEAGVCHALGQSLMAVGARDRARRNLERALELRSKILGVRAPETVRTRRQLGLTFTGREEAVEFDRRLEESAEECLKVLGPDDSETWEAAFILGRNRAKSDPDRAFGMMDNAIAELRRTAGPNSLERLRSINYFVSMVWTRDRAKAIALTREMVAGYETYWGPDELDTFLAKRRLADFLQEEGEMVEAETLLRSAWELAKRAFAPNTTQRIVASFELAETLILDFDRYADGLEVLREVGPVLAELDAGWVVVHKFPLLEGYAMWNLGGEGEAIEKARVAHEKILKVSGPNGRESTWAAKLLVEMYRAEGDEAGVKRLYEQHPPGKPAGPSSGVK